jgi:hypothetical protein
MTTIERWTRGLSGAIATVIAVVLLDYFHAPTPIDQYRYYLFIGCGVLFGYLGGSRDERKSNRIHLTS